MSNSPAPSHAAARLMYSATDKAAAYVKVSADLDHFFEKYGVDTAGRMATINSFLKVTTESTSEINPAA